MSAGATGQLLGAVLVAWSAVYAVVVAAAGLRARRYRPQASQGTDAGPEGVEPTRRFPDVLVVRPADGDVRHLARSLASLPRGPVPRVRFTVADGGDPALPTLQRVCEQLTARGCAADVRLVRPQAANYKASQLAGAVEGDPAEVVLVADADVELGALELGPLLEALEAPEVAAVWVPVPEGAAASPGRAGGGERARARRRGIGDRASAAVLGGSLHAFPLLCGLDPHGLVGKLFAVRAADLAAVGGFGALADVLGEDFALSRRLREAGRTARPVLLRARALDSGRPLSQVIRRFARWVVTVRTQRPGLLATYPLLIAAAPPLVLLGALGLGVGLPGAAVALVLTVSARLAAAGLARSLSGERLRPTGLVVDAVLGDLVLWAAFLRALASRRVEWRGRALYVGDGGVLVEAPPAKAPALEVSRAR